MTIRHTSTIYCDRCTRTRRGGPGATEDLRRLGWLVWRNASGHWRHLCPSCPRDRKDLL